ncbi:hypothetical protein PFISCL1PPCAC_15559, partial [Pristionchus fissidentatus]
GPWLVDEAYKKEFAMKDKLAPIFCKPVNGNKKDGSSGEDEIMVIPTIKKKRESNDSLKENGEKKDQKVKGKKKEKSEETKEDKEKKGKKRKEDDGMKKEKVEKKRAKKEAEANNFESTDDEAPLSMLIDKIKEKKQKQGLLDKFITTSPSSSKSSPTKKKKGKVERAMDPLFFLYNGEDCRIFLREVDKVIVTLKKEEIDGRIDVVSTKDEGEDNLEAQILKVIGWRKMYADTNATVRKIAIEERAAAREANRKELDAHPGKMIFDKLKERMKTAKALREIEEEERGEDYEKSMGKLPPSGRVIESPHFPTALMLSEFVYTRSSLFPANYRLPFTEEIMECLSLSGKEKEKNSRRITYPLAKILLEKIVNDEKYSKRFAFCETSVCKIPLDENTFIELLRVLVTGERPSTKDERDAVRKEMERESRDEEDKEVKEEEERPTTPQDEGEEEETGEADVTIVNEENRSELLAGLDGSNGRWERMEGRSQGLLLHFLLHCYIDCDGFEIRTDGEVQEEYDDLKREKKELKGKIDELNNELKEVAKKVEDREKIGLRTPRLESGRLSELEEILKTNNRKMEEIVKIMKGLDNELSMAAFAYRVNPIGMDRHGRRYMLMPHYAGLLVQSIGSGEWIKEEDGSDTFGFIPMEEEWREVTTIMEWDELSEKLKNGSKNDKKLMKAMEKNKETFQNGLKWAKDVEENKKKDAMGFKDDDMYESTLSEVDIVKGEMTTLLEKVENGELMKVKDISILSKKLNNANSFDHLKVVLQEYEDIFRIRAKEEKALFKSTKMADEYSFHSISVLKKRIRESSRLSELVMLMKVMDYRTIWNYKELDREKEAKKEQEKREEERKRKVEYEEEERKWESKGIHTRRFAESVDKKAVRILMKKVIEVACGRLASTLNGLESDDETMMNMKDIEDECHRYSLDRLKKILRKNVEKWRYEIESRFSHRLEQFDEFAEAVYKLL